MSEVEIHTATASDAEVLNRLCREHAEFEKAEIDWTGHTDRLAEILDAADGPIKIYLAVIDRSAVGFASVSREFSTWKARHYLHMDCLYVIEGHRNRSVGALLIKRLAADASHSGISEIEWQTPEWNVAAVRFYERLGATHKLKRRFRMLT
jgi:GNAT superfamily N-acetyltransferase